MSEEFKEVERLYTTTVRYEDDCDGDYDIFVTLDDCYYLIKDITQNIWKFDEGWDKKILVESLKESNVDERFIKYVKLLEDEQYDRVYDAGTWTLIFEVLRDCGQLVEHRNTGTVWY